MFMEQLKYFNFSMQTLHTLLNSSRNRHDDYWRVLLELSESSEHRCSLPETLKFKGDYKRKVIEKALNNLGFDIIRYTKEYCKTKVTIAPK